MCRCDERIKTTNETDTLLTCTGLHGGLEHLKIETRLINKRFASVMGELFANVMGELFIIK